MFSPHKLLLRLIVVGAGVLLLAHHYQRALLTPLLPLIQSTLTHVQDDFTIQSLDIVENGPNEVLRLHANLARPTYISGRMFYPIGWQSAAEGGYEIRLTVGGTIQYSLLILIVVLAWPAGHWRVALTRLLFALPLMLLNTAITFPAELWNPIHEEWLSDITWPLLVASKMLMGGGGLILGLLCGAGIIAATSRDAAVALSVAAPATVES